MKKNIIGIIGGGNMGEALVKGLMPKHDVRVCEISAPRVKYLKDKYPELIVGDLGAVQSASVIVLAVKPQDMQHMQVAFSRVSSQELRKDKLFISIAAGLTTKYFEKNFALYSKPRVVRAMPNMPALIGEGITGICRGKYATMADLKIAEEILNTIGQTVEVKEDMMDALTAVSGSGPAYVFLFVEMWIAAAMCLGLTLEVAERLVLETLVGSAHLIEKKNFTVQDLLYLRARVTSKGGTTEAAMNVFFKNDALLKLMKKALSAAKKRAKELAK